MLLVFEPHHGISWFNSWRRSIVTCFFIIGTAMRLLATPTPMLGGKVFIVLSFRRLIDAWINSKSMRVHQRTLTWTAKYRFASTDCA